MLEFAGSSSRERKERNFGVVSKQFVHMAVNVVVSEAEAGLFGPREPTGAERWGLSCAVAKQEAQLSFANLTASRCPRSALAKSWMAPTVPVLTVTGSASGGVSGFEWGLSEALEVEQTPLSTQTPAEPNNWEAPSASRNCNNIYP